MLEKDLVKHPKEEATYDERDQMGWGRKQSWYSVRLEPSL